MKTNPGKKPVRVHLLTGESILLVFDAKATSKDVFDQVCSLHSIKESHFFGLSAIIENEPRFMDPKQKLNKYAPKEWGKELRRRDSDLSVQPSSIFTVQFQVQYFVEHPKLIRDPNSRHHYYLQLKKNLLQSKVPTQDEVIFTLAATSLHIDLGKFDPDLHVGRYFDPNEHVPLWFAKKWSEDYLWSHLPALHAEMAATSSFDAEADYINKASTVEDVPVHYYKLYKTKREPEASVILGIYHQGIRIHHVTKDGAHLLDFEFPWARVGRLFFAARRFDIYPVDQPASRKLGYYTGSHARSKYLLRLLRETHTLYMSLTPFVQHMKKADGNQGRRHYRESYISGQDLEKLKISSERLVGESPDGEMSPSSDKSKQTHDKLFKSYTSSTSHGSSHTSGIESDSKQRTEEEEDDNAFMDDFDPIERDYSQASSSRGPGGVIFITQEHLEAPQHKSLSVTDLTEASPGESVEDLAGKSTEPETSSESAKSEQTIKADPQSGQMISEVIELASCSDEATEEQYEKATSSGISPTEDGEKNNNANSNVGDGEIYVLETNTLPHKSATIRTSGSRKNDPQSPEIGVQIPAVESSQPELPHSAHPVLAGQNSTPEYVTRPRRQGSKTFYDDTDTILFGGERTKSSDLDYVTNGSHAVGKQHGKHEGRKHHRKRNGSDMKRSGSVDSSLNTHASSQRSSSKADRAARKEHQRHQRHKSLQDSRLAAEATVSHGGPHFASVLSSKKSVDDLFEEPARPLNRSHRHRDIPDTLKGEIQAWQQGDYAREYNRKLSDACQKAFAEPQVKVAEERLSQASQHHQHNNNNQQRHRHKSHEKPRHKAMPTVASNGHAGSTSAGHTPRKHEVLLRTKYDKTREDRRRPVSYHLASGPPPPAYYSKKAQNTCYNDAALTSRPPVYLDSFKEVIV